MCNLYFYYTTHRAIELSQAPLKIVKFIRTQIERFSVHCHSEEPTGDEESQKAAPPRRFFAVAQNDMHGAACTHAVH